MTQPREALLVLLGQGPAVLIFPVRRNPLLGHAVHLLGADLHLERLAVRSADGSVQRLVQVGTGNGDEILDAARHGPPGIVNDAQGGIAIFHAVGEDADSQQVVNLIDADLLPLQLLPDAEQALDAPVDARRDGMLLQLGIDQRAHLFQEFLADLAPALDRLFHVLEGLRFEMAKRQVFEFAANFPHPQPVRDGGVDFDRLPRNPFALFGRQVLERAHVVKPVRQFHQHHADIVHHGQDHLAKVFGLLRLWRNELDAADLGHPFDDARHVGAEFLTDAVNGGGRVFDHVVQHACHQAHDVQLHVRQHVGDCKGVRHERLPGDPRLRLVLRGAEFVRFPQQAEIVPGARNLDLPNDFFKLQHTHPISL